MGRATSATVYGYSSQVDVSRVNARRPRRAYGLRSGYMPDGWVSGGARPRKRRVSVDSSTNLVAPAVAVDDDEPLRIPVRTDFASERRSAGVIRMGEW